MPFEYPRPFSPQMPAFFWPNCPCCAAGPVTTRKFDSSGNLLWIADHGAQVTGLVLDSVGNVFTSGVNVGGTIIRKYDNDGVEQSFTLSDAFTSTPTDLAIDSSDNLYITHSVVSSKALRKYDSSGTLVWSVNGTPNKLGQSVSVDGSGNVYAAFTSDGTQDLEMFDSSGASQWTAHTGAGNNAVGINEIDVDAGSGDVYAVGNRVGGGDGGANTYSIRKWDNAGTFQWGADHGDTMHGVYYLSSNVYAVGNRSAGSGNNTMRKYNAAGALQWSHDDGRAFMLAVRLNASGDITNCGDDAGFTLPTEVFSYNSTPTLQWSAEHGPLGITHRINAVWIDDDGNVYMAGGRVVP